jgi:uncharacterized protein (DUF1015 family)
VYQRGCSPAGCEEALVNHFTDAAVAYADHGMRRAPPEQVGERARPAEVNTGTTLGRPIHMRIEPISTQHRQALADFVDPFGLPQRLYAISDPEACRAVTEQMADKVIFIADGHHRYETALNYRNHMRGLHPDRGDSASFNYVLTYLCSMNDPGLTVFPCHRVLPRRDGFDTRDFLPMAAPYFTWSEIPAGPDRAAAKQRLQQELAEAGQKRPSFGLVAQDSDRFYVLSLKEGVRSGGLMAVEEPELRDLDVVVLTDVVLDKILGLDNQARDQLHTIKYASRLDEVVDEVMGGQARLAFLLNPTRVDQVQAVAEAGLIMPRKSTYFYPKVLTGLVLHLMDPAEDIPGCPQ